MKVSHTALTIAQSCWKKYYWRYEEGLKPKTKSYSLTLGSIIHKAFHKFRSGLPVDDVTNFISNSFDKEISNVGIYDEENVVKLKYTALGMWLGYPWKDEKFQKFFPEEEFVVPIADTGADLRGFVDGRVKQDDTWWVYELKTTGSSRSQFEKKVQVTGQAKTYVYGLRKKGYDVNGVLYDCIGKPRIKKRQNDTMHDYGERIVEYYKVDSERDEKDRKLYFRVPVYCSKTQLSHWLESTMQIVEDIIGRQRSGKWYREDFCMNWNRLCPYHKLCRVDNPDKLTMEMYYDRSDS